MIDRAIIFLILGFFVFAPSVQSFWSDSVAGWYTSLLFWLALIVAAFLAGQHDTGNQPE